MTGYLGEAAWICEPREFSELPSNGRYFRSAIVHRDLQGACRFSLEKCPIEDLFKPTYLVINALVEQDT